MRLLQYLLAALLAASASTQASAAPQILSADGAQDRLIIQFKPGTSSADAQKAVEAAGMMYLREIADLGLVLAQSTPGLRAGGVGRQ